MNTKVIFSRITDEWRTPWPFYARLMKEGFFDPCPIGPKENGLEMEWPEKCYVNPPYSKLRKWVEKCIGEASRGKQVLMLIPARTDTQAFKELWLHGCEFWFITGRLHFSGAGAAPFPSLLVNLTGGRIKSI